MFKKLLAIAAMIGVGVMAQSSIAAAHPSNKYHSHKKGGYEKPYKKFQKKHVKKHHYNRYGYHGKWGNHLRKIRHKLRYRGFYNIRFTDRHLPVYKAIACKRGKRVKLIMNRWGNVMWRKRIGWCHH